MNYINEVYDAVSKIDSLTESSDESYLSYIVTRLDSLYSDNGISVMLNGDEIYIDFSGVDLFDLQQCLVWFFKYRNEAEEYVEDIGNYSGDFEVKCCDSGLIVTAKKL